jgi:signal transduction histidine kinase
VRGPDAVLEVRDTGIGMSRADQERVLAPFRRAAGAELDEVQGAGLGLSIVKAIIDSHGGTIAVESAPGRGTTVTLTLPRNR